MKRLILYILPLFIALNSFSQTALTFKNNAPITGNTIEYIKIPYVAPGEAGPNQAWDFTGVAISGEKLNVSFQKPSSNNNENDGGANIILRENDADYYFKATDASLVEVGGVTKDYTLKLSDPLIKMIYPFAYGDHYKDSFSGIGDPPFGEKITFGGDITVAADAFGTLFLAGRTFTDVLRVKTISSEVTINPCSSTETNVIRYFWYAPDFSVPIMSVSEIVSGKSGEKPTITKSGTLLAAAIKNDSVKENPQDIKAIQEPPTVVVYPNPFADKLSYHFFLAKPTPVTITLTDLTGKTTNVLLNEQQQSEGLHSGSFEAIGLSMSPGLYYIRFVFDQQVVVKKVVKL